jgi:hypothetical protein
MGGEPDYEADGSTAPGALLEELLTTPVALGIGRQIPEN